MTQNLDLSCKRCSDREICLLAISPSPLCPRHDHPLCGPFKSSSYDLVLECHCGGCDYKEPVYSGLNPPPELDLSDEGIAGRELPHYLEDLSFRHYLKCISDEGYELFKVRMDKVRDAEREQGRPLFSEEQKEDGKGQGG